MGCLSVVSRSFPASNSILRACACKRGISCRPRRLVLLRKMGGVSASASSDWCGDGGKAQNWEDLRSGLALESGGLEYAVNRSSKWIVSVLFAVLIVWKHDTEALWTTMGSVLNSSLCITLKHLLKHERPVPALKSSPGMPSSHAQSIFYAVVFAVLSTFQRLGINIYTITGGALLVAAGWYLSWLRVTQQLHTIKQVAVGAILGTIFSTSWYFLWHLIVLKAFVSSVWVRLVIVPTSVSICSAFLLYAIKYWLKNEDDVAY